MDENIKSIIDWADVIIIGPGLGITRRIEELVDLVTCTQKPLVIDADAINILANRIKNIGDDRISMSIIKRTDKLAEILPENAVLTPHPMELARLLDIDIDDISDNIFDIANQCSYNNELVYVMKNARTIVACSGKKYINISGNCGMATAGSGDVLTGIIAGLLAQGMESYEASCLAVYIHGLAGDLASEEIGTYSLMAGNIADAISNIMKEETR